MKATKLLLGVLLFFEILFHSHAFSVLNRRVTRRHAQQGLEAIPASSQTIKANTNIAIGTDEESFTEKLLDRLRRNDTTPFVVEGYVTSKREIGKNLAFLDFQIDHGGNQMTDSDHNLCQALLRKDIYKGDFHYGYRRCLLKGCKFRLAGVASATKIPGNVVLMLHSMELLALPRQAQHMQIILQQAVDGNIPFQEVIKACSLAQQNAGDDSSLIDLEERLRPLKEARKMHSAIIDTDSKTVDHDSMREIERHMNSSRLLKRLTKDILNALPDDPHYPVAADQKVLSKEGNFIRPPAPKEWQIVPEKLQQCIENSQNDTISLETSRVKETLVEIRSIANSETPIDKKSARVSITGWVQNRRRFEGNITMIYLVDSLNDSFENGNSQDRLPCLVHPDILSGNVERSSMYQNLIASSSKVRVEGQILFPSTTKLNNQDDNSEARPTSPHLLRVQNIELVRSSHRSVTIRHLLDLLFEKQIDPKEASEALLISHEEAKQLSLQSDVTQRQWKANLFAVQLQKDASANNRSTRIVDPTLLNVLEKYRYISKAHPVIATGIDEGKSTEDDNVVSRSGIDNASSLLQNAKSSDTNSSTFEKNKRKKVIFYMPGSKWQIKKKPQLQWMTRQIREVLESHQDFGKRKLTILDIGGGKGALANYLGQNLGQHVRVHVVDISQGAIRNGKKKAERLDLPVDFQFADASNSNLLDAVEADIVVALHACGHLSDIALNHAVHRKAGFVIVPCCFNSNPHLMIPNNDRDSSKGTNLMPVPEWLGLPAGDWDALKLLAEVQNDIALASEAIGIICAIRAEAVKRKTLVGTMDENMCETSLENHKLDRTIKIKSFPIQFSTRNTVLVRKCT